MSPLTDFLDDKNLQKLNSITNISEIPEFVKEGIDRAINIEGVHNMFFADPVNRKFPCHTKTATWLSAVYFFNNDTLQNEYKDLITNRIEKAAERFGIKEEVGQLKEESEPQVKSAADYPDTAFAFVHENTRKFPIIDEESITKSAEAFDEIKFQLPLRFRREISRKIIKAAHDNKVSIDPDLNEYLHKAAGFGVGSLDTIIKEIAYRVLRLDDSKSELKVAMVKLADTLHSLDTIDNSFATEVADTIDLIDRETGLNNYYVEGVPSPEEVCFTITEKSASECLAEHITLTTGTIVKKSDLQKITDLDKIASVMGHAFLNAVMSNDGLKVDHEKFAEIASTLPRRDAEFLEIILKTELSNEK